MSCRRSRAFVRSCRTVALSPSATRHAASADGRPHCRAGRRVVLAVGVMLWMRPPAPAGATRTAQPQLQSPATSPERPVPSESEPAVAPEPSLEQLARVEPPRYQPLRFRGLPDEATARFQRGMEHYRKADYGAAVADLRAAAELDPDAAHIRFFLGISHLMLGQDAAASIGFGQRLRSATHRISKKRTSTWRRLFCGGKTSAPPKPVEGR